MKLRQALATLAAGAALAAATTVPSHAATHKWANTHMNYGSLTVRWCAGGTATLRAGTTTRKDVCAVYQRYNTDLYVYVTQTGTELFDTAYCGSGAGRWVTFTSRTDTSREANVTVTGAQCA